MKRQTPKLLVALFMIAAATSGMLADVIYYAEALGLPPAEIRIVRAVSSGSPKQVVVFLE